MPKAVHIHMEDKVCRTTDVRATSTGVNILRQFIASRSTDFTCQYSFFQRECFMPISCFLGQQTLSIGIEFFIQIFPSSPFRDEKNWQQHTRATLIDASVHVGSQFDPTPLQLVFCRWSTPVPTDLLQSTHVCL